MKKYPSHGARMIRALLWSAVVSLLVGMLIFAWGQLVTDPYLVYHTSIIEFRGAINIVCVVFWLTFAVFYLVHIRQSDDDVDEERHAAIAEAWLDRRRLSLLRGRSRRR